MITVQGFESPTPIGSGGYSTVFRAMQPQFNRWVALKVLSEAAANTGQRRTFERECKAMGLVSRHPHIVNILSAAYTTSGQPVIVMELFDAGTVWERVERSGPISAPDVLDMGIKVASALETAHQQNLLHRDLKPQNIMYSEYGQPALGDFGISRLTSDTTTPSPGGLTLHYAPPERIEGEAATPESDIYSLAATLYTALAGRRPFQIEGVSQTPSELTARIVGAPLPPIDHVPVPKPLFDALAWAMAKDPMERPSSAADFARTLQQVQKRLNLRVTPLVLGESELEGEVGRIASTRDETTGFSDVAPTTTRRVLAAVVAALAIATVSVFVLTRPADESRAEEVVIDDGAMLGLDNPEFDAPIRLRGYRLDVDTVRLQWVHNPAEIAEYQIQFLNPERSPLDVDPTVGRHQQVDLPASQFGSANCVRFLVVSFLDANQSIPSQRSNCDAITDPPPMLDLPDACLAPCAVDLQISGLPPSTDFDVRLESVQINDERSIATGESDVNGTATVPLDLRDLGPGNYLIWAKTEATQPGTPRAVIQIGTN